MDIFERKQNESYFSSGFVVAACDPLADVRPKAKLGRMASLWREIIDTIDGQISVRDTRFVSDLRFLIGMPAIPFLVALCFVDLPSTLGFVIGGLMFAVVIAWTVFLFRRQAAKKQSWVEPTRFSDENNGY